MYLDYDMALRLSKKALDLRFWSTSFYAEQINLILNRISEIENIAFLLRNDGEKSFKHIPSDFDLSSVFSPVMTDNESRFVAALMLSVVDEFPAIVTDRLHVGIAAILMGKEVYLLDNSYGKVFSVYRHSFSHMANVYCCRSVEDIHLKKVKYQSNGNLQHLLNALM